MKEELREWYLELGEKIQYWNKHKEIKKELNDSVITIKYWQDKCERKNKEIKRLKEKLNESKCVSKKK